MYHMMILPVFFFFPNLSTLFVSKPYIALVSSHAGDDKWEKLQKDKMKFLMNTKWNGKDYSLEKFCGIHRTAFVQMEEASLHVEFQLPNEHSRVGYLIDNIVNSDPDLRAAIAQVRVEVRMRYRAEIDQVQNSFRTGHISYFNGLIFISYL